MLRNKQILTYRDLAEECSLLEAIYYMAFEIYPTYLSSDGNIDIRRDSEYDRKGEFGIFSEIPEELILENEICKKYGLPENPHYLKYEDDDLPWDYYLPIEFYIGQKNEMGNKIFKNDPAGLQKWNDDLERQKSKILAYQEKLKDWERALELKLQGFKTSLLKNVSNGKIKAYGKKLSDSPLENKLTKDPIDEENWTYNDEFFDEEFGDIANDFWKSRGLEINWESSRAASFEALYYADILLSVEDLIKSFPKKTSGTNLNSIIRDTVDSFMRSNARKPKTLNVWKEIKNNMENYKEIIIEMKEPYQITWRVNSTGSEKIMTKKTFQNLVSKYSTLC